MTKQRSDRFLVVALLVGLTLGILFAFAPLFAQTSSAGGIDTPRAAQQLQKADVVGLNPFLTVTQPGDYVAAGIGLRGTGAGEIVISGIPAAANVTHAFLYWAIVDSTLADAFDDGIFAGTPITGALIGTDADPCWEFTGVSQSFAFRADVTTFVSGNGAYELSGFASGPPTPTSSFKEPITLPLAEGATLVVLYQDPAAIANRDIVLYDGAVTIRGVVTSTATVLDIPPVGSPGSATTTFIVADGQDHGSDATRFNGTILASDGFSNSASFDGSDGLLWDTDTYDVSGLVNPGDESVRAEISKGTDCVVHVAQVFSAPSSTPISELTCELEILSPGKGAFICPDSVEVQLVTRVAGGRQPVVSNGCSVNAIPARAVNDSVFSAVIALTAGLNSITANCTFTDQDGGQTTCEESILVIRAFPPACAVTISSPSDSTVVCGDSLQVVGFFGTSSGVDPISVTVDVNGFAASVSDSLFSAIIPLDFGDNVIVATTTITDSCGNVSVCRDTVTVLGPPEPNCVVEITAPIDGAVVCGDSIMVTGVTTIEGGLGPFAIECFVNGFAATVDNNGGFVVTIPADSAFANGITATCIVTDNCGTKVICLDTITIEAPAEPICVLRITSPADSFAVCGDSLTVTGIITVEGVGPFDIVGSVNGVTAAVDAAGNFIATIPLQSGNNSILATAIVTDSCGTKVICVDNVTTVTPTAPICVVEIQSPADGETFCGDSLTVRGQTVIEGGLGPFSITSNVNGVETQVDADGNFVATIPLEFGVENIIIATSVVVDSCGLETVCADTIVVQPPPAPVCTVEIISPQDSSTVCGDSLQVTGRTLVEGGLGSVTITSIVNGVGATVGADGVFIATIPLELGVDNIIIATSTVIDSCGTVTVCSDTIVVQPPPPPVCVIEITSPRDSSTVCGDSLQVTGRTLVEGGLGSVTITTFVNGVGTTVGSDGVFMATIPLDLGVENIVIATSTVIDSCGTVTVCADTIVVIPPPPPVCTVEITSPRDGSTVCGDSLQVTGLTLVEGGLGSVTITTFVNGVGTTVGSDGAFMATLPLDIGVESIIIATSTVTDSCGTVTVCADTIVVQPPAPPICNVQITDPQEGAILCGDSLQVSGITSVEGDFPPFAITSNVNGIAVEVAADGSFMATVPLLAGSNDIIAVSVVTDSCGSQTTCTDTVSVVGPAPPICEISFPSLSDSSVVCDDVLQVEAIASISGGLPPFEVTCDINGVPTEVVNGAFSTSLSLESGANVIVATCSILDSCGVTTTCSDSITVLLDDTPPECEFAPDGLSVAGTFTDDFSGIAELVPIRLRNGILTLDPDPFTGARKVNFRIDPIDPNESMGFVIDVIDSCGNVFRCDPVYLGLDADRAQRQFNFTFPSIDRYFQLSNQGLTEVRIELNGKKFTFYSDPARVEIERNAFFLPLEGILTIDLQKHLTPNENTMAVTFEGPAGSSGSLLLIDLVESVDFVLELESMPTEFTLAQNYPNPFNPTTKIRFAIPVASQDVQVRLRVFNLLGELVRVLVDEQGIPGEHEVEWDGRDKRGQVVSSGIYVYQLVAGEFRETRRMLLLK